MFNEEVHSQMMKPQQEVAPTVLTIGHSTRTVEEFIILLQAHTLTPWAQVTGDSLTYPEQPV